MRGKMMAGLVLFFLAFAGGPLMAAQDKAAVEVAKPGPFHPGETVTFSIKLNAPMPKGAHFAFRISPVSADEEIDLGSGQPIGGSDTDFRISWTVPDGALPGEWHIQVIYFFLAGASWTGRTLTANDLRFQIEGKPFAIPTQAEVSIGR